MILLWQLTCGKRTWCRLVAEPVAAVKPQFTMVVPVMVVMLLMVLLMVVPPSMVMLKTFALASHWITTSCHWPSSSSPRFTVAPIWAAVPWIVCPLDMKARWSAAGSRWLRYPWLLGPVVTFCHVSISIASELLGVYTPAVVV